MIGSIAFSLLHLFLPPGNAKVLPTVLAGIAKFAHLIDVGVALDIISVRSSVCVQLSSVSPFPPQALRDMVSNPGLPLSSGLSCVLAVYRILSGPGKLLNVDDSAFSTYLLSCIPRLALPRGELFTLQVHARTSVSSSFPLLLPILERRFSTLWMLCY